MNSLAIYVIANYPSFAAPVFFEKLEELKRGKVACVQLRDDRNELPHVLAIAEQVKKILGETPLFINTRHALHVAQTVGASGVYFEAGTDYLEARRILGPHAWIGMPVRTMDEVIAAEKLDVNYLSVKVFPSKKTCPRNDLTWGMEGLRQVRNLSSHRIVAIGGIDLSGVEQIYEELRSDDGIAMAGGLMGVPDPYDTVQKIWALHKKRFFCDSGMHA